MASGEQHSDLPSTYHSANVACYLRDINTEKVYGVTNKHVTLHGEQIYIKQIDQHEKIKLGICFEGLEDVQLDVGLISIDPLIKGRLRNKENPNHHVRIYPDSFKSIYCKEVMKYKPSGNHYEICEYDTSNFGVIASESEHDLVGVEDEHFLIKGTNGNFATKGESGTAIVVKPVGNTTDLIGLLCGGTERYTVCLFLPFIIQYFEMRFGFRLQLYEPEYYNSDFEVNENQDMGLVASKEVERFRAKTCIPSGVKIYFICPTPEEIAPLEFNLIKHTLALLCMRFNPVNLENYELLVERHHALALSVNERGTLSENAIFENDRPEFVAIEKGIRACDYLYIGKATPAETNLKLAISCVVKSGDIGLRLLCKLVTYITWYCLVRNSSDYLNDMKDLLTEAIDIFESDFKDLKGFPSETLGYMYFDFSRYYMAKWENKCREIHEERSLTCTNKYRFKAVDKARKAVAVFKEDHKKLETPETARRLVLAKCQCIYSLLGCGHSFDLKEDITNEEIKEAEEVFNGIHLDMTNMPMVQNIDYLLSLCDLQFRKGYVPEALDTAKKCLLKSKDKGQKVAFHRATCRVKTLLKLL